jgi:hypothetical protein
MKFNGKELFELGVPQNKIKLFIGRDFSSKEELLGELKPKVSNTVKVFTWVDWCFQNLEPYEIHSRDPVVGLTTSRAELKRVFDSGSIEINGKFFTSTDECKAEEFPLQSITWFPKNKKKRNTFWRSEEANELDMEHFKKTGSWERIR